MKAVWNFFKNEAVLAISFLLALSSVFLAPPNEGYLAYIDWRTLALLFCLMAVMAGLNRLGVFRLIAQALLRCVHTMRGLSLTLILLCYFFSMLITNDVALITFVPLSIVALRCSGRENRLIPLIALETVAANLGSMLTPIGNPQNLYLFSAFQLTAKTFFSAVAPYGLLSGVLLVGGGWLMGGQPLVPVQEEAEDRPNGKLCAVFGGLFLLALLTVFRVLPWPILLGATLLLVLLTDRKTLNHLDYSLLLTFAFLFIFIGNLGGIDPVCTFLREMVSGREVIVGILASQVLSNVPAAILLSGFTQNASALLVGVNLGGLGTLIASMASLISFKYMVKGNIDTWKYIGFFTFVNVVFLVANMGLWTVVNL